MSRSAEHEFIIRLSFSLFGYNAPFSLSLVRHTGHHANRSLRSSGKQLIMANKPDDLTGAACISAYLMDNSC
ncbi:hypothetical protein R3I94_006007 [Phoxinus phoxinus]